MGSACLSDGIGSAARALRRAADNDSWRVASSETALGAPIAVEERVSALWAFGGGFLDFIGLRRRATGGRESVLKLASGAPAFLDPSSTVFD